MYPLTPPLNVIEDRLFAPSNALIQRWIARDPSLPSDTVAALDDDPDAGEIRQLWRETTFENALPPAVQPVEMPARLRELIERRVTARRHAFSPKPRAGQILRVEQPVGPQGALNWDMGCPLAVLIAEPLEHPEVWYGWLVSHETDYAGYWDLLLEEEDEPYDPSAKMIQVWNPVQVYLPSTSIVLAELPPARLATLYSLVADFVAAPTPDPVLARPGSLVERLTQDGRRVMTGTPLRGPDDPRWRYQELYFAAADMLKEPARMALAAVIEEPPQPTILERLLETLRRAAATWQLPLEPEPEPVFLGPETASSTPTQRLGDLLRIQLFPDPQAKSVRVFVALQGETPLVVKVFKGDRERQQRPLTSTDSKADFFIELGLGLALVVADTQGATLVRWELPE